MARTTLAAVVAAAAMVVPAAVMAPTAATATPAGTGTVTEAERGKPGITGKWKGGVYGDEGGPAGYTAKVTIVKKKGKFAGKINYPGTCSGTWKYQGKKKGWFTFREKITRGATVCVSPVHVKVKRVGAKLKVVWREPLTGDVGTMKARRI